MLIHMLLNISKIDWVNNMEISVGSEFYIVSVSPYIEKAAGDKIYYEIEEAKKKRDSLNYKYYGDERIKPWKVFRVVCNVDKEEIK